MAKNNYKNNNISTGRVDKNVSSMAQLFGEDVGNKFGTLNFGEYEEKLNSMTLNDLQDEARKINCPPIDDKERLKRSLKNEFRVYASNFNLPPQPKQMDLKKVPREVLDFMSEGK